LIGHRWQEHAHILSEPIVRTLFKRKQAQDTEYTHFISKEGHSQSNVSENTCKNSLDAIRIFLRTIEDTYQVDKITWNSGNTTEKLWKLSAENFWIN
jgi:hypothetical protein